MALRLFSSTSVGIVLLLLTAFEASAASLLPPPNIILPNYDRTLIGENPSLESGAYSARVDDASSNWYNPAGLALAPKTVINASTSAYRWTSVQAQAGGAATGATTGGQPPSFVGVVIAPPVMGNDRLRVGISMTNETFWAPVLQSQITDTVSTGIPRRILYSTRDNFTETLPAIALGYRISDSFRIGISVAGDLVSFQANDTITSQVADPTTHALSSRSAQINAQATNLLFTAGAQYEFSDRWKASLSLKSPGMRLFGSAKATVENQENAGGNSSDVAFFDPDTTFRYNRPLQAALGLAFVSRTFELEVDGRFHAAIGPYPSFSSTQSITTTTSTGGGAATTTTAPFNDVETEYRRILDLAIGAKYRLSDSVEIHAGYFRSTSPLADGDSTLFRKVDLNGVTGGASLKVGSFSGSLGLAYEFGKSDPYQVQTADPAKPLSTVVNVNTLSILYALSFAL